MAASKPTLPKGTRDFGPVPMARRLYLLDTIRRVFCRYGFAPIETPSLEQLSVLTGKYGDEGDQLIFKVLNSGDYLRDITPQDLQAGHKALTPRLSEKALRYDLTVPFARFVVMNRNELTFPFRRYQMQPVWRADRPQRGRYREFYQCDADVVGTDSLLCEAEIVLMITDVMAGLRLDDYTIKINHRKILTGVAEAIGAAGREAELSVAIDKLDKIGWEGVRRELAERGFAEEATDQLARYVEMVATPGAPTQLFDRLATLLSQSDAGTTGLRELRTVFDYLDDFGADATRVAFDVTLARGLSYYTGAIFEVKINNAEMGSVSGGGRYDNLTGVFGLPGLSGVGISFGVDRLYDVLDALNLFPEQVTVGTQVLIAQLDEAALPLAFGLLRQLRAAGLHAELYPDVVKLKKQMTYAHQKQVPFVVLIGEEERKSGKLSVKNMATGDQLMFTADDLVAEMRRYHAAH